MRIYTFLGLPGSGKGTQAEIMAKKTGAKIFGMGDLIRNEIAGADLNDPFYKAMKERYDQGTPQPDEVAVDIIRKNLADVAGDVILDNFPFTKNQADLYFELIKTTDAKKPILVWIKIDPESSLKRILNRKVCSECKKVYVGGEVTICEECGGALVSRPDDKEEVVRNRVAIYQPKIKEVVAVFGDRGILVEINGEQTIPEVEKEIEDKVINAKFGD